MSKVKMMSAKDQKKGALVPRLRFPEFRDAGEWEKFFLGEYSEVVRGGSPRPIDNFLTAERDGLNWLKIGDINKEAKYVVATTEKVRAQALNKTREISPGDLILSNSMSFGRPYISKIKTCIHDGWIAITEISKKLHVDYIYYLISSPFSQHYFTSNAAGSGVQNLNADIIKSLPIFSPNILEQQRIADCLSSLDERITAENSKLNTLKDHKKGLLKQLFPAEGETLPQLRFPEFRDAGEWGGTTIGKICKCYSGGTPNTTHKEFYGGNIPFIRSAEIGKNSTELFLSELGVRYSSAKLVKRGAILVALYGANSGEVAISPIEGVINQAILCLESDQNNVFLYYSILNIQRFIIVKYIQGGQGNLSAEIIKSIQLYLPNMPEQQRIADCLFSLDELITAQTQKIDLLKTHKKGLMQQLFPVIDEAKA